MESLLPDWVKSAGMVVILALFGLSLLARRFPDSAWLQKFRLPEPQLSAQQKERRRRAANRVGAVQIALAGFAFPVLYLVSCIMMFNDPKPVPLALSCLAALACWAAGAIIFIRNRHA